MIQHGLHEQCRGSGPITTLVHRGFKLRRHDSEFESSLAERGITTESLEDSIQ